MALGSVIAASLLQAGWSPVLVIPIVLLAGSALGLVVGIMISRFEIQPFIATLAAMFLARGLCLVITDRSIAIDDGFFQSMNLAHINLWEQETVNLRGRVRVTDVYTTPSVLIAMAVLVVAFVVLHYSRFGRTVYAVGGNEPSSRLMGLRVDRTKVSVYVISGFCAGDRRAAVRLLHRLRRPGRRHRLRTQRDRRGRDRRHAAVRRIGVRARVHARRPGVGYDLCLQGVRRRPEHRVGPG